MNPFEQFAAERDELRAQLAEANRRLSDGIADAKRLRDGWDRQTHYSITLQRIIESLCRGRPLREEAFADAPHHARMAKDAVSYAEELRSAASALLDCNILGALSFASEFDALRAALAKNQDPCAKAPDASGAESTAGGTNPVHEIGHGFPHNPRSYGAMLKWLEAELSVTRENAVGRRHMLQTIIAVVRESLQGHSQ